LVIADRGNYLVRRGTAILASAQQTITFTPPGTKIQSDAAFALNATASSGLPVSFSIVSGPATLSGNLLTLTGPGMVVVRASQTGNSDFIAASAVDVLIPVLSVYEGWRASHFTPSELVQVAVAGPLADADGDGLSNFMEYALGSHPRLAAQAKVPVVSPEQGRLKLNFLRARAELTYTVESSSDLTTWTTVQVNPGTVGNLVDVLDTTVIDPTYPRRFLRLSVSQ